MYDRKYVKHSCLHKIQDKSVLSNSLKKPAKLPMSSLSDFDYIMFVANKSTGTSQMQSNDFICLIW